MIDRSGETGSDSDQPVRETTVLMVPAPIRPAMASVCLCWIAVCAAASLAPSVHAGVPTLSDCVEGSDFIANAAHSRDNGMGRDAFVARMQDDFVVIRSFPPALRWFAKDHDDERFLLAAVARVYERPRTPAQHRADFLVTCLERLGA